MIYIILTYDARGHRFLMRPLKSEFVRHPLLTFVESDSVLLVELGLTLSQTLDKISLLAQVVSTLSDISPSKCT